MLFLAILLVVSSEGLRGVLQDTFAYLASYPSLFIVFLLFGFCVAVASSYLHFQFAKKDSNSSTIPLTCFDCEQQNKKSIKNKKNKKQAENVGILAMEVYFPANYIDQSDLEQYDGVGAGKYTKGLAQEKMSFTGDLEDVNSIALTAVKSLLEKFDIHPSQIGRLEVGTETMVDLCKSTKTVLMDLFHEHGNYDLEGVTSVNACYGGTAALFNSVAWVESKAWDGRYALVVCGDIAVYAKGPARPTSGCGAVAMLIGPNAPLVMESELRTTFSENMWDFYKPDPHSEYPTVDGKFSQSCYLKTLDDCYRRFCVKNEQAGITRNGQFFDVSVNDYVLFHSPYNKLAQKGFSRIVFNDFLRNPTLPQYEKLKKWHGASLENTYYDRELDAASREVSLDMWNRMVEPSCFASRFIGNCYTASVYINLACLVDNARHQLHGKRIMMFSYGSGAVGSIFSFRCVRPESTTPGLPGFTVERMSENLNLAARLNTRLKRTPEEFNAHLDLRESSHGLKSYNPVQSVDTLFPGTYYLVNVDDKHRRKYARKSLTEQVSYVPLPSPQVSPVAASQSIVSATPVEAKPKFVDVVVTGVAAGTPGMLPSNNISGLLAGMNMIQPVSQEAKESMVAKKIVQLKKEATGAVRRLPVSTTEETIQLAAPVYEVDLVAEFGLPKSLAEGMDQASACAVAAGLRSLQQAGLVEGKVENGWGNWRLPDSMAASTGVLYAASFPSLDSAVKEVSRSHTDLAYEFDRKLLFKLLVLANSQLAQIVGARGPNAHVNATCAGTTVALAMAQDWIRSGKCQRVVVIAGDVASNGTLLPWIGSGFRSLGAASIASKVEDAALPFDTRRNGMILGSGAVGLVLEAKPAIQRQLSGAQVHLVASQMSNSAFHGASLDKEHMAQELNRFLQMVETEHGISRAALATEGVYYSHETCTQATPTSSCSFTELYMLRSAFGDAGLETLVLANTKGFTGHAMGVSFEEVIAVEGLKRGLLPPVVNFASHDSNLSARPLRLSQGGAYPHVKYALRFAAGFGSQIAFTLYARK